MDFITVVKFLISAVFSLQCCCQCLTVGKNESVLIVTLPQVSNSAGTASWGRGEEIVPGALVAAEDINNFLQQLHQTLTLVIANSGPVTSDDGAFSGNVLEIVARLTWQNAKIVGIAGILHPKVLYALQMFELPIASLVHFSGTVSNPNSVTYMTASTSLLIESIHTFMKAIGHSKIGIISETSHPYYSQFFLEISTCTEIKVSLSIPIYHPTTGCTRTFTGIAKAVADSNLHIILLNISPALVAAVLCQAYRNGLVWPKVVWILHSYRPSDIPDEQCDILSILQGVFFFQLTKEESSYKTENDHEHGSMHLKELNPYTNLLYNAVWRLALANHPDIQPTATRSGHYVYMYQVLNGTPSHVGLYNGKTRVMENFTIGEFIVSKLPIVRMILPSFLLLLPALCSLFNTVLLILYIYFRNEPSVKSTSICLSLLIFTGSYLLIAYTVLLIANIPPSIDVCMVLAWLSGIGVSLPLMLATILVKMLRVYRIFTLHKRIKPRAHTSELAHFLYTAAILSPNIVILTVWTVVDPHRTDDAYVEHPGFIAIEERCRSDYVTIWFLSLLIYCIVLSVAVVTVAIKSRKIRTAQFKDTKKVNFLIFSIIFIGVSIFAYSNLFSFTEDYLHVPVYILYAGHIAIAFLCQVTLFGPKLWPPLCAKLSKISEMTVSHRNPRILVQRQSSSSTEYKL